MLYAIERRDRKNAGTPKFHQGYGKPGRPRPILLFESVADAEKFAEGIAKEPRYRECMRNGYYIVEADEVCNLPSDEWAIMGNKRDSSDLSGAVRVFEDAPNSRYAIESRCESESQFLTEVVDAISADEVMRRKLRGFLPLVVDMACKYRGYRADSVIERKVLVTGDLEIPE